MNRYAFLLGLLLFGACSIYKPQKVIHKNTETSLAPILATNGCAGVTDLNNIHRYNFTPPDPLPKKKFDMELLESNVKEALLELSIKSGIPILVDENVTGLVSVNIKKKSFLTSLDLILSVGPFDYKYKNNSFIVGAIDTTTNGWWKIAYQKNFILDFVLPSTLVKQMHARFRFFVSADDSKNILSVNAPRKIITEISSIISELDIKRRQIILKVQISEITARESQFIGNLGFMTQAGGNLGQIINIKKSNIDSFFSTMDILRSNGDLENKANPTLIAQEGKSVKFDSLVKDYNSPISGSSNLNQQYIQTGIELIITPRISQTGDIILRIDNLQMGDLVDNKVFEHNIKTTVRVKRGESIIIGGMLTKKNKVQVTKIPVLGDIPLIGWFFKKEQKYLVDSEIIFFIKPEIYCGS